MVVVLSGGARSQVVVGYDNPACDGKTVIIEIFEWKWTDVALECERFLAQAGYCGVQVINYSLIELIIYKFTKTHLNT